MPVGRRAMVVGGSAALVGAALPLSRLFGRAEAMREGIYGPLLRDPAGIMDLPPGFTYRVLQRAGVTMTDGYRVPWCFDGMSCFAGEDGNLVLMRNHENGFLPLTGAYRHGQAPPSEAYDPNAYGGVTRVVVSGETLEVVSSNLVLTGTVRNCAGGPSPWGWLSCEEDVEPRHGYVFLCRTDATRVRAPERIPAYGRFRHEAVCIDPSTHVAYLTEDREDGCLYRFVPANPGEPFGKGRFQAMGVVGTPRFDTSRGLDVGTSLEVEWLDVTEPDPEGDTVRVEARTRGAATVKRGEGIWFEHGPLSSIYVCSTNGGPRGGGQIFRLTPSPERKDGHRFQLLCQSTDATVLDMPDNITVAPNGAVFMAEDSVMGEHYVRVLSPDGKISDFGRNAVSRSELAGVCFSPDGGTLFVNVYGDGLTLGIRGPFQHA